jgi:hypothetical protein
MWTVLLALRLKQDRLAAAAQFRMDQPVVGPGVPLTDAQCARIEPLLPDRTP